MKAPFKTPVEVQSFGDFFDYFGVSDANGNDVGANNQQFRDFIATAINSYEANEALIQKLVEALEWAAKFMALSYASEKGMNKVFAALALAKRGTR
jgi:hypothetical protein